MTSQKKHIKKVLRRAGIACLLSINSKGKKTMITSTHNFIVDDDYFRIDAVSDKTGESIVAMDKDSNWTDFY